MQEPTPDSTLREVKAYLHEHYKKGVACPACAQFVREYNRPIAAPVAANLIRLYRLDQHESRFYHINEFHHRGAGGGDFAKLTYWGLVETGSNDDPSKRASGMWRITDKGRQFVRGERELPKYAVVYAGRFLGYSGDTVTIHDCLKKKFDYSELMSEIS